MQSNLNDDSILAVTGLTDVVLKYAIMGMNETYKLCIHTASCVRQNSDCLRD